jgi:hypothetical protein
MPDALTPETRRLLKEAAETRRLLKEAGFYPIPCKGKAPTLTDFTTRLDVTLAELTRCAATTRATNTAHVQHADPRH